MRWTGTRLDRTRRRLGLDRNDLRRRIDRLQWFLAAVLLVVFLTAAPATAAVVAGHVYDAGLRTEAHEAASRHQVVATIVGQNAQQTTHTSETPPTMRVWWRAPDGSARTADVPARGQVRAGAHERIWVDDSSTLTTRPRRHIQTIGDTIYAAFATTVTIGTALLLVYCFVRRRCDRRRARQWEIEWALMDRRSTL